MKKIAGATVLFTAVVASTQVTFAAGCPTVTVISDPLPPSNIRSGPSRNYGVVTTLPSGIEVVVDANKDGWAHISSPVVGWVAANHTMTQCAPQSSSDIPNAIVHGTVHSQVFWDFVWGTVAAGVGALFL